MKQTNKQTTIYFFNKIQAPGLHIIQYYNIHKSDHNDDDNINYKTIFIE